MQVIKPVLSNRSPSFIVGGRSIATEDSSECNICHVVFERCFTEFNSSGRFSSSRFSGSKKEPDSDDVDKGLNSQELVVVLVGYEGTSNIRPRPRTRTVGTGMWLILGNSSNSSREMFLHVSHGCTSFGVESKHPCLYRSLITHSKTSSSTNERKSCGLQVHLDLIVLTSIDAHAGSFCAFTWAKGELCCVLLVLIYVCIINCEVKIKLYKSQFIKVTNTHVK